MNDHSEQGSKVCAYCKGLGPFTREHIIPNFLYKKLPQHKFGYHPKADRFLTHEATIRDVCVNCNNGSLSKLDKYGEFFYSRNRCHREFHLLKYVPIEYNFYLLLRWLLKISYNAIRAFRHDNDLISGCVPFILSGEDLPYQSEIFLEIVRNYKMKPKERECAPKESKDWKYLPAEFLRIGGIFSSEEIVARFMAIKAFYFYIFISSGDCPPKIHDDLLTAFHEGIPDAKKLDADEQLISVRTSRRSILDAYGDQMALDLKRWHQQYPYGTNNLAK